MMQCPLCLSGYLLDYYRDKKRNYLQCRHCDLVFVEPCFQLPADEEKAEYDLHENSVYDEGYRQFLSRVVKPLQQRLNTGDKGLDFGCGPAPALVTMMAEFGWEMSRYDLFYYPDTLVLNCRYQFVTATELVEHVYDASALWPLLWSLLEPRGILAIMTKRVINRDRFASWHYKNDKTHLCFYSEKTFLYLAELLSATITFVDDDVVFLKK